MLQPTFSRHYNAGKYWRCWLFSITKLQKTRTALAAAKWVRTERDPASIVSPGQAKKILYILCELTAVVQDGALRAEFGYQLYIVCLPRKQPVALVRGYSVHAVWHGEILRFVYRGSISLDSKPRRPQIRGAGNDLVSRKERVFQWRRCLRKYEFFPATKTTLIKQCFCLRLMSMQQHWKDIAYDLYLWEILMVLIIASERALSLHTESMRQ